jgi:hypothetical protein
VGTVYNVEDYCVYLSWARQAADGQMWIRDMFTTDPQRILPFNCFFFAVGRVVRLTRSSIDVVFDGIRILAGACLLILIYRFYKYVVPKDRIAYSTGFAFAAVGSGLAWVAWPHWDSYPRPTGLPDAWQPEAYVFLTIQTSPFFTVSTVLIVGSIFCLLLAEKTGKLRWSFISGGCGALLGNIHTYDVIHIGATAVLFVLALATIMRGKRLLLAAARVGLSISLMLPSALWEYWVFRTDPVLRDRMFVLTLSPPFWWYVLGYGVVFMLAVAAIRWYAVLQHGSAAQEMVSYRMDVRIGLLLVMSWSIAGLVVVYLPVPFQRKLIMGEHVPLCLLAGIGVSYISRLLGVRPLITSILAVLLAIPSNILFVTKSLSLSEHREPDSLSPYISSSLVNACDWLHSNTKLEDGVVGFSSQCAYIPGLADRRVWCGHWGETPHFGERDQQFLTFADAATSDASRKAFLRGTNARYLIYPIAAKRGGYMTSEGEWHRFADFSKKRPTYLTAVFANDGYTIFRVDV